MSFEPTIITAGFRETREAQRHDAALAQMIAAFNQPVEGTGGADSTEPVKAPMPAPEVVQPAVEVAAPVPDASPRPAKKARKASPKEKPALMPYMPAEPVLSLGSAELHPSLIAGALDAQSVQLMTRLCGDPVSINDGAVSFGARERLSLKTTTQERGYWRDSIANVEGRHFHTCLAHLLNVDERRALEIALALSNGHDLDRARLAIERRIGKSQATGFKALWENALPLRESLAMRPLREQSLGVRFSSCDYADLRGNSEGCLLTLHRDAISNGAVGLPPVPALDTVRLVGADPRRLQ